MKGIYLNLPDDVYIKVQEIASQKGHLTKTAAIRLMIMEYGQTNSKKNIIKKPQKQERLADETLIELPICLKCGEPFTPPKNDSGQRWCNECNKTLDSSLNAL